MKNFQITLILTKIQNLKVNFILIYTNMLNLKDSNFSCIIFDLNYGDLPVPDRLKLMEKATSILYSKEFTVYDLFRTNLEKTEKSLFGVSENLDNESLRRNAIYVLETFHLEKVIVKYTGESNYTEIKSDGSESGFELITNILDEGVDNYFINGFTFRFEILKRYNYPRLKQNLKAGMVVEYLDNNNNWKQKTIVDLEKEYDSLYNLLMKYNKLRYEVY